jgi:UDP-glucose 4-epimerase
MRNNILVTGGAGYIGSHTVIELLNNNYNVIIVDNFSNSSINVIDNIYKITGINVDYFNIDCCDKNKLRKIFESYNFDAVIHFAAYKAVGESMNFPLKYYYNNILSLINVIDLMTEYNCNNIVFSSSASVYGENNKLPLNETSEILTSKSVYGYTKQICEKIILDSTKVYKDFNAIILRYFNPIGAHPSIMIGEATNNIPQNLLPYLTKTAVGIYDFLNVYGNDYSTPDGTCLRDYIDIMDLSNAHVKSITRLFENINKSNCEIFNIGSGKGISVLEIIKKFEEVNDVKINYKIMPRRPGDVESLWADITLANNELKWSPQRTLEDSLKTAYLWELKNYLLNKKYDN